MKKALLTAYFAWGGVGEEFWICDFGLGTAEGDKVNLELHTRSQGQSNLVKPNLMLGNMDWLKRDSEFLDLGVLAHGHWGKVQGSKFRVQSGGVSGFRPVYARKTGFARYCSVFILRVLAPGHVFQTEKRGQPNGLLNS